MERKCQRDSRFGELYRQFMREYEELKHMELAFVSPVNDIKCYLPHHGVIRESSTSTKLRVVFNGSQQTTSDESLNHHLLVGANLLPALTDILMRWRWHRYAFVTDIEKMYRQILIHPDDQKYQCIIWHCTLLAFVCVYLLLTVTYGLACAPFLAIRTLEQLTNDEQSRYPRGAITLLEDTYVDDAVLGANTLSDTIAKQTELRELCTAGGFPLLKWAANCEKLQRLDWDDPLPAADAHCWKLFLEELPLLSRLRVNRWLSSGNEDAQVELHGFADASERGYAAAVYLRITRNGTVAFHLLAAKSKVAPVKQVSLPQLELTAAALLTSLTCHTRSTLVLFTAPTFLWSAAHPRLTSPPLLDPSRPLRCQTAAASLYHVHPLASHGTPTSDGQPPERTSHSSAPIPPDRPGLRRLDLHPHEQKPRTPSAQAFIAVFVCLCTKAVHLDVVSDYTTEAFLGAFRRFTARRGLCEKLYSDSGTNFLGADRVLRELFRASSTDARRLAHVAATEGIKWHFNPPVAPHFGGLWEAAVKSTKFHLRRVIGETKLTFEEMSTFLAQVEACLNSRLLQALFDDPDDMSALTPGHFLIGAPLLAVPEPFLTDTAESSLSRWQHLQKMRDHFWSRWSHEYINGMIARSKWLKSEDLPSDPCAWCALIAHHRVDGLSPASFSCTPETTASFKWRRFGPLRQS
ncbi:uncharacterized protein [Temnothorax longispinosus]|uniref:uncharacterized protein n=1 Tax=Temnothorax longispinosus TaxID=300112 RepID=UPI003A99208B